TIGVQCAAFVLILRLDPSRSYFAVKALELAIYFLAGSLAYLYRDFIKINPAVVAACLAASVAALPFHAYAIVGPWCLSYCVMAAAMWARPRSFDRRVDLSYGVYIYAFPIQQLLATYGLPRFGFTLYLVASAAIAGILALASWTAIERP